MSRTSPTTYIEGKKWVTLILDIFKNRASLSLTYISLKGQDVANLERERWRKSERETKKKRE